MKEKLQSAFIRGLGLADGVDFESLHYSKSRGWDSIAHMQLVAAIEAEFGIRMETSDILAMSSFDKAQEILAKHAGHMG